MEVDVRHMTEKIWSLTLEIIFLLTGETFPAVKLSDHVTITVSPPPSLTPKRRTMLKILDVANKITELLAGEDIAMETWECLEGHSDEPILLSPDGSGTSTTAEPSHSLIHSKNSSWEEHMASLQYQDGNMTNPHHSVGEEPGHLRVVDKLKSTKAFWDHYENIKMEAPNCQNTPQGSPHPLYSQDSTQEVTPHPYQDITPVECHIIKEEIEEEGEDAEAEVYCIEDSMVDQTLPLSPDESSTRNFPKRSLRPLYSQDSTQEVTPHHYQTAIGEVELVMEESDHTDQETPETALMKNDKAASKKMDVKSGEQFKEEEGFPLIGADGRSSWYNKRCAIYSDGERDYITSASTGLLSTPTSHPALHPVHLLSNLPTHPAFLTVFHTHHPPVTSKNSYSCLECGKDFLRESEFIRHKRIHTGEKPYSCSQCGRCFSEKSNLTQHERVHTGERPYSCSECVKSFCRKTDLVIHERVHTGEKPYLCSECGKSFSRKSDLISHDKVHTRCKSYSCSECGETFSQKKELISHETVHTGDRLFSCTECNKTFTFRSKFISHKRVHTRGRPYPCSECGKCFSSNANLIKHVRVHTGEKPYSCSECGKCFSRKDALINHQICHTGQMPYSCSECGKGFARKSDVIIHKRIHTGEKPYSCSECGKYFSWRSEMMRHKIIHAGGKPYSCSECGKSFFHSSELVNHLRVHTGEKPFSCSECGKCFSDKSNFTKHKRIHTGERPFICTKCGKCFSFKSTLNKHHKVHIGKKSYSFS